MLISAIVNRAAAVTIDRSQGETLVVVPIIGPSHDEPEYRLLGKENADSVTIEEVSDSGSVPVLRVRNESPHRVFLMDGQELRGAKQNRIVNTDVLVPAGASVNIPVSCVEQGRWRRITPKFSAGKAASYHVRRAKIRKVSCSLDRDGGFDADQSEVWEGVSQSLASLDVSSPTAAMADAYAARQHDLDGWRNRLQLPENAVGAAIFDGERFAGLDLFDRHSTLQRFWNDLIDSYAFDLLRPPVDLSAPVPAESSVYERQVRHALASVCDAEWRSSPSPAEGIHWRLESKQFSASALVWEEKVVVHLQLFSGEERTTPRPR